jgi:catechol 2,3-dioxygenase-like lactoylglutathione lyase family enzyme
MLKDRGLIQVALPTADLPRAVGFYRDILGLPLLFEVSGMAFFQLGNGTRLMVGGNAASLKPGESNAIYFDAPDLPALAEGLARKGVVFLGPAETLQRFETSDLKLQFFRDPDGNLIGLMGNVPRGAG